MMREESGVWEEIELMRDKNYILGKADLTTALIKL